MSTIAERYDQFADRYEQWWAPVLAPTARNLLDVPELATLLDRHPDARILDVGVGSGTLALAALERWPRVDVTGADASAGMLDVARGLARQRLRAGAGQRLTLVNAEAARMPVADASFDAVISSFVYQLVPNRAAALREARRVLRPGGVFATVTWLGEEDAFEPDEVFEDALDALDMDFDEEPEERSSGNFQTVDAAAAQVRRAGFRSVRAESAPLVFHHDPATYADFLEQYAESGLFEGLSTQVRDRLRADTRRRLAGLPAEDFVWRSRVVTVAGIR